MSDAICDLDGATHAQLWAAVREACRGNDKNWDAYQTLVGADSHTLRDELGCSCGSQFFVVFFDDSSWCAECLLLGPKDYHWDWSIGRSKQG